MASQLFGTYKISRHNQLQVIVSNFTSNQICWFKEDLQNVYLPNFDNFYFPPCFTNLWLPLADSNKLYVDLLLSQ